MSAPLATPYVMEEFNFGLITYLKVGIAKVCILTSSYVLQKLYPIWLTHLIQTPSSSCYMILKNL